MNSRFGRTRRRRLQSELISAQEAAIFLSDALITNLGILADQQRKIDQANDYAARVAKIIGNISIASEQIADHEIDAYADFQMLIIPQCTMSFDIMRMLTLSALQVEAVRDHLAGCVAVKVRIRGKQVGMALSDDAILTLPLPDLIATLSQSIAEMLAPKVQSALSAAYGIRRNNVSKETI